MGCIRYKMKILGFDVKIIDDEGLKLPIMIFGKSLLAYTSEEYLSILQKGTQIIFKADQIDWDNFYFYLTVNHWYKKGYGLLDQVLINWKGRTTEEFREAALAGMFYNFSSEFFFKKENLSK